jgi:serpin B
MGPVRAGSVLEYLRRLAGVEGASGQSDSQLLAAYAGGRAEAFAELVQRHSGLVYNACRRILGDSPDAEDAFQATFLVLAKKAGSVGWRDSIAGWLHEVACRTAQKIRTSAARRKRREEQVASRCPEAAAQEPQADELRPILDVEVGRLPDKYRLPVVLCYLEGRTNEQAARLLRCPESTVRGRLSRARDLLRSRLANRGLMLSSALLGTLLEEQASASAPGRLVELTLGAAAAFVAGSTAETNSAAASELARGVLHDMAITKLKWMAAVVALLALSIGTGLSIAQSKDVARETQSSPEKETPKAAADEESIEGTWYVQSVEGQDGLPRGPWRFTATQIITKKDEFGYKLRKGEKHRQLDILDEKNTMLGIVQIQGGTMKLCIGKGARPTEFTAAKGSGRVLVVFQRETQAVKDRDALQGRWKLVAADIEGRSEWRDNLKKIELVIKNDSLTLIPPAGPKLEATITLDPDKKPKAMDLKVTAGPGVNDLGPKATGKTLEAIYALAGDELRLCWDESTLKRPAEFKSTKGGPYVMTFQRDKMTKATVRDANNAFAFDLYGRIKKPATNLVFSPYSLSSALSMAYAGARGDTAAEIAKAAHFTDDPPAWHPAFSQLAADLRPSGDKPAYQLQIANALWGHKDMRVHDEFQTLLKIYYGSELRPVDFVNDREDARGQINAWVKEATRAKIKELLGEGQIPGNTRAILTNAVYFRADWETPFSRSTYPDEFHLTSDRKKLVDMMHEVNHFQYYDAKKFKLIELPYKDRAASMLIVLPAKIGDLEAAEKELTVDRLTDLQDQMRKELVKLALPRFKIESSHDALPEVLKEMGIRKAFVLNDADFTGITGDYPLFISKVIQKAVIDVNEKGTEAAAATAIVAEPGAEFTGVRFVVDRPFLFLLRDNRSGAILFLGRVCDLPEVKPLPGK